MGTSAFALMGWSDAPNVLSGGGRADLEALITTRLARCPIERASTIYIR